MSLIKKLLGLGSSDKPKPEEKKSYVNRAHRVHVSILHNLNFLPNDPPFADKVPIGNVSLSGIGLYVKDLKTAPKPPSNISGKLSVEGVEVEVTLEVKQKLGDLLGCSFVNADKDLIQFLRNYFEVELEVFSLKPETPILTEKTEQNHLTGSEKCQIWWQNTIPQTGALLNYRLSFFGNFIEGGTRTKVRYGSWISGQQNLNQAIESIHSRVHWETHFPESDREKALKVINYAPELSPEEKKFLRAELKKL